MTEGIWHGGDLGRARALFPDAPEPWIDLSTGINPIPYPLPALPLSLWQRLPAADDEAALLAAARNAYRVTSDAGIAAAPGTQILIDLLPRVVPDLIKAGPVSVLGPTYAEHALAWRKMGATVVEADTLAHADAAATVVVVNPNNPDGRLLSVSDLTALAARCSACGGMLVVDEAFCDFTPEASLVRALPPATIVLRSFGKTYGLAGVRLGFAIGEADLVSALRDAMGPWAVAGPALAIGAIGLADADWLRRQATARAADAARLDTMLAPLGEIVGGTALFRLLATPAAPALFAHLGACGIYVRRFQQAPTRLRFGLPGDAQGWARLEAALSSFVPPSVAS